MLNSRASYSKVKGHPFTASHSTSDTVISLKVHDKIFVIVTSLNDIFLPKRTFRKNEVQSRLM